MTERMQQTMIEAEAVEQFLRLSERVDPARRAAEFSEWLTRSPAHVEAFLAVVLTWNSLDLPAEGAFTGDALIAAARAEPESDKVVDLSGTSRRHRTMRRRRLVHAWRAAAAAAVVAVAGWIGYANITAANVFRNESAEIRRVTLADGSMVSLNPNSEIHLRWTATERRLDLRYGRARFHVAKNPQRPFLVNTQFGTVRAVGTIFDVDAQRRETRVTVIEGRVAVETDPRASHDLARAHADLRTAVGVTATNSSLQLAAGDRAKIIGDETAATDEAVPGMVAWTEQRVVFRGATLDTVIDEFNRYRNRPVIINDLRLSPLLISGVFDPKNPDSLLSYLELYEGVKIERMDDGSVLISGRG